MKIEKMLVLTIMLGLVLTLFSWRFVKSVPCGQACWGETKYHGYPLKYYYYGMGDLIYGNEWRSGTVVWDALVLDFLFWLAVGFIGLLILSELNKDTMNKLAMGGSEKPCGTTQKTKKSKKLKIPIVPVCLSEREISGV